MSLCLPLWLRVTGTFVRSSAVLESFCGTSHEKSQMEMFLSHPDTESTTKRGDRCWWGTQKIRPRRGWDRRGAAPPSTSTSEEDHTMDRPQRTRSDSEKHLPRVKLFCENTAVFCCCDQLSRKSSETASAREQLWFPTCAHLPF